MWVRTGTEAATSRSDVAGARRVFALDIGAGVIRVLSKRRLHLVRGRRGIGVVAGLAAGVILCESLRRLKRRLMYP